MRFEQASADISEHELGDRVADVEDALFLLGGWSAVFGGIQEEFFEVAQRELIHRIDEGKVGNDKVEHCASDSNRDVEVTRDIDGFLYGCGFFQFLLDDGTVLLTLLKSLDELGVIKNVAFTLRQQGEDVILSFFKQFLAIGDGDHDLILLPLDLRQFKLDDIPQQLVLKSFKSDTEVDDGHFDVNFW